MAVTRRDFLRSGAAGVAAGALPIWLGRPAFASSVGEPLLVVVFLRGGADGLSLVPPVGDPDYDRLRGTLAVKQSLSFVPGFGLHPGLEPLQPLIERKQLAVIHAAGSQLDSRSHFEAQDYMEMGSDGARRLRTGWLARGLRGDAEPELFETLALSLRPPLSLRGANAFAMPRPHSFGIGGAGAEAQRAVEQLYATAGDDPAAVAGRRAFEAVHQVRRAVRSRGLRPARGRGKQRLLRVVEGLVTLERANLGLRACFLEIDGWDTHAGQGAQIARPIGALASGLARLFELTAERRDLITVVMTEFGRTARPNGSGGTDHGHGSVMLVAGPRVRGGVYGNWPGLSANRLWQGRDLDVTTDYRHVLYEVLRAHLGRKPPADTFPDFRPSTLGLTA